MAKCCVPKSGIFINFEDVVFAIRCAFAFNHFQPVGRQGFTESGVQCVLSRVPEAFQMASNRPGPAPFSSRRGRSSARAEGGHVRAARTRERTASRGGTAAKGPTAAG